MIELAIIVTTLLIIFGLLEGIFKVLRPGKSRARAIRAYKLLWVIPVTLLALEYLL